jgi:hypothetical protein
MGTDKTSPFVLYLRNKDNTSLGSTTAAIKSNSISGGNPDRSSFLILHNLLA